MDRPPSTTIVWPVAPLRWNPNWLVRRPKLASQEIICGGVMPTFNATTALVTLPYGLVTTTV